MTELSLRNIYHGMVSIGEAADKFCREHPHHRFTSKEGNQISLFAAAKDLATEVENACRSLSVATRERIART